MSRVLVLLQRFDWVLFTSAMALTAVSLVAIYGIGISQDQGNLFLFYKQLMAAILGCVAVIGLSILDYRHTRSFGFVSYLIGGALLFLVLFFGRSVHGTQGWFHLFGLSFQPVECAKLTLVCYVAALYSRHAHGRLSWRVFGLGAVAAGLYAFLVMLQPDFGSAMVLLAIWGGMSLFAGLPRGAWIILPAMMLIAGTLMWTVGLKPYQQNRILTFLDPVSDPLGSGYNAAQARIAIGSGGWFGKGIGEGSQARLRFLPEAATDFMFAVLGEELGFVGVSVVLGLFFMIFWRLLFIAYQAPDDFASLLLIGFGSALLVHVVENAGMNLGITPITGIPMPFISAAASSLVFAFISIGFAQSVAVRRRGA